MIFALDTSTHTCKMYLLEGGEVKASKEWLAERRLAKELLGSIESFLQENGLAFSNLTALAVFRGPGSFTGLRIGVTVINTLADSLNIPILGEVGDDWQAKASQRIAQGENDSIVLPEYGAPPHITQARK